MNVLSKLWPYTRPHKNKVILVIFFGVIMAATASTVPMLVQALFDLMFAKAGTVPEGTKGPVIEFVRSINLDVKYLIPLLIILNYLINGIARFFHLYILKLTTEKIVAQIRLDLQQKILKLSPRFHSNYETGSGGMLSKTINDIVVVQWGFQIMADILREPVTALFLLGWILYLDWKLTLFSLTVVPLIFFSLKQLARSIRKYAHSQQESLEDLTSHLKESLDGVRVIQSFNLQNEMKKRMRAVLDMFIDSRRKILAREEIAGPLSEFLSACLVALIVVYMAEQVQSGLSTTGAVVSFIAALGFFQQPVKKLQDAYIRLQQTVASTERIFEILENPNEVPQTSGAQKFPKQWSDISFENVTFRYDKNDVLKKINLRVSKGEVIAIVGESGSGKSTLVNLLERFFDPTEGKIKIGGVSINEIDLHDLRKNIALVTQDVFLFNDSIERNIQSGDFEKQNASIEEAAKAANANEFIMQSSMRYSTRAGDRGGRLSGGERQRISIARAFYKDAPILILDEATSALDSASEVEVQKGLESLMKDRTVFVIAHRLSTIINADRIIVMKSGEIVEEGKHQDLIKMQGAYAHFYKLQALF